MRVFLTGGSGYLGRATIAALRRHGHQVEALARNDAAAAVVVEAGATAVTGDLDDLDTLRSGAARAEAVVHLAQASGAAADVAAAAAMWEGVGAGPYVHTGGTWVYGDTDGVVDETAPWNPPPIVAWRQGAENEILSWADRGGRPIIVQPGLVYGGRNRLIDYFFTGPGRAAGAIPVIGDGANRWALVHVDDVAELYALALQAKPGSVYAAVGGVNPTALEVARAVSHGAGLDGRPASITRQQAYDQMGPIADAFALDQQLTPARARADLGWQPVHLDPLAELSRPSR